jgi:hypothetical protein
VTRALPVAAVLRQVLKQAFWDSYDLLGRLLVLNFALFLLLLVVGYYAMLLVVVTAQGLPPGSRVPFVLVASFLVFGLCAVPVLSGLFHMGALSSAEKDPSLWEFLRGVRRHSGRMLRFVLALTGLEALLAVNVWFYFAGGMLPESLALPATVLGGVAFWLMVVGVLIGMHGAPLVVRRGMGARAALRWGFVLTLKYPWASLGTFLFLAAMLVIGMGLKFVGLVLYGVVAPVMLANSLHDVVLEREEQGAADGGVATPPPTSWRMIRAAEEAAEERRLRRARYERTFRDILRPWEM